MGSYKPYSVTVARERIKEAVENRDETSSEIINIENVVIIEAASVSKYPSIAETLYRICDKLESDEVIQASLQVSASED